MYKAQNQIFFPWRLEDQRCQLSYLDLESLACTCICLLQSPLLLVLTLHLSSVPGPILLSVYFWCWECVLQAKMRVCVHDESVCDSNAVFILHFFPISFLRERHLRGCGGHSLVYAASGTSLLLFQQCPTISMWNINESKMEIVNGILDISIMCIGNISLMHWAHTPFLSPRNVNIYSSK